MGFRERAFLFDLGYCKLIYVHVATFRNPSVCQKIVRFRRVLDLFRRLFFVLNNKSIPQTKALEDPTTIFNTNTTHLIENHRMAQPQKPTWANLTQNAEPRTRAGNPLYFYSQHNTWLEKTFHLPSHHIAALYNRNLS